MRRYLIGLAAAAAVTVTAAPAMACYGCGGSVGYYSYYSGCSPCGGYSGAWGFSVLPTPVQYYAVQPQYYYVQQGPTYTGPGMFAPVSIYQPRVIYGGDVGYYGYNGGPYAHPANHYYAGAPAVSTPTVYSYRRVHRRHGYRHFVAPRYSVAPYQYGRRPHVLRRYD